MSRWDIPATEIAFSGADGGGGKRKEVVKSQKRFRNILVTTEEEEGAGCQKELRGTADGRAGREEEEEAL